MYSNPEPPRPQRGQDGHQPQTDNTKLTGPYKKEFQQHLTQNGMYMPGHIFADGSKPPAPANKDAIVAMLKAPSTSALPSDADFDFFGEASDSARSEADVMKNVIPLLEGPLSALERKCTNCNILFTNLDQLTWCKLPASKPDLYHGSRPEDIHEEVRNALSGHIIPSRRTYLPATPNFFLEAKSARQSSLETAQIQAFYDGCLGARGMHSLRSYKRRVESTFDSNAYTLACTYQGGTLIMYSFHCFRTERHGQINYVMTRLGGWYLLGDADFFRKGVLAYRNAMKWTREQRDQAIQMANETVNWDTGGPNDGDEDDGDGGAGGGDAADGEGDGFHTTETKKATRTRCK